MDILTSDKQEGIKDVKDGESPFYTKEEPDKKVDKEKDIQDVVRAALKNSDFVGGYHVTSPTTPGPNAIVPVDNGGMFTAGPLKRAILISMLWGT